MCIKDGDKWLLWFYLPKSHLHDTKTGQHTHTHSEEWVASETRLWLIRACRCSSENYTHTASPGLSGSSSILKYWVAATANLQKKRSFMCILVPLFLSQSSLSVLLLFFFFSPYLSTLTLLCVSPTFFFILIPLLLLFPIIVHHLSLSSFPTNFWFLAPQTYVLCMLGLRLTLCTNELIVQLVQSKQFCNIFNT